MAPLDALPVGSQADGDTPASANAKNNCSMKNISEIIFSKTEVGFKNVVDFNWTNWSIVNF